MHASFSMVERKMDIFYRASVLEMDALFSCNLTGREIALKPHDVKTECRCLKNPYINFLKNRREIMLLVDVPV